MTENNYNNIDIDSIFMDQKELRKRSKEYQELEKLYEKYDAKNPQDGEVLKATYIGLESEYYIFSYSGYKDYIRVENKSSESKYLKNIKEGDIIDLIIKKVDNNQFFINGSIAFLHETKAHEMLKSIKDDSSVLAHVKDLTPAGYDVDILYNGVTMQGFMPNTLAGVNKLHDPESIIGNKFNVIIESYSDDEGTYIVSRKRYLNTLIPEEVKKLKYDVVYNGHVTGTTPFGVFVEFNECLTGMVHKVNINESVRDSITSIAPGTTIEFYIKDIIKDKGRYKIILTQILRDSLWDSIEIDQVLKGKIKDIKSFGLLVSLDEETTGLVHISEVEKMNKKMNIDDDITVRILSADKSTRKIFLGIV